jgi:peroxiredoxin
MGTLLQAGRKAPLETLPPLADGRFLLVFFKISCPVCQMTLPYLNRVSGLKVYGVSQNDAEGTREFVEAFGLTFEVLRDSEDEEFRASNAFGISHVPTLFIVSGGRIERVIEGWDKREMEALGAVTAGDNVPAWKAG